MIADRFPDEPTYERKMTALEMWQEVGSETVDEMEEPDEDTDQHA
jgi:hypothetical protein